MKRIICMLIISVSWVIRSYATVILPSIFTDGMVLQQNSVVAVWGKAAPKSAITITTNWNKQTYTTKAQADSTWKVNIRTTSAGGPYIININDGSLVEIKNVLLGEVWLASGQSNMEMPLKGFKAQPVKNSEAIVKNSENNVIRFFDVKNVSWKKPLYNCAGEWKSACPANTVDFSATAYLFALNIYNLLNVPVGIIESDWGGTPVEAWMSKKTLSGYPVAVPAVMNEENKEKITPSGLYNAMIHPIVGYGIKGVIWYQGEQNRDNPQLYSKMFPAMVKQWRKEWGIGEFPFYYAQIAPYLFKRTTNVPENIRLLEPKVPALRESQLNSEKKIKNSGMAVLIDVGEQTTIHPADKQSVANRLFLIAKAKTYGYTETKFSGPSYSKMEIEGNKIILNFKNTEAGLKFSGTASSNFEIAGTDKVFYPAKAVITGSTITVYSDKVAKPVAARYAYKAWVVGDLFNSADLPASSFRTDKWEINSK